MAKNRSRRQKQGAPPRPRPPLKPRTESQLFVEMKTLNHNLTTPEVLVSNSQISAVTKQWTDHSGWTRSEAQLAATIVGHLVLLSSNQRIVCLDRKVFTNLLNAFAKSEACPHQAENILDYMKEFSRQQGEPKLAPDRVAINTVIGAYAKSKAPGSADHAHRLLKDLEDSYLRLGSSLKPNSRSYCKVIDAYARELRLDCARKVLRLLEDNYRDNISDVPPSVPC